jgi:hypothetical protein
MQSVSKKAKLWKVDFFLEEGVDKWASNLMGWTASKDPNGSLRGLYFNDEMEAVNWAKQNGICGIEIFGLFKYLGFKYEIITREEERIKPKSYADNFAYKVPKKMPT